MSNMFGIFTPLIRRFEHQYIGRKVELVIEKLKDGDVFYYSAVLRLTQDGYRQYTVGNTKHLGNTALNTEETLRTMMMSRFISDMYTSEFQVTSPIQIVETKFESKLPEPEPEEELGEWEYFDYHEDRDDVDIVTYSVDDCIIYNRHPRGEYRLHQKLDEELEDYFYGKRSKYVSNPFHLSDLFEGIRK